MHIYLQDANIFTKKLRVDAAYTDSESNRWTDEQLKYNDLAGYTWTTIHC